MEKSIIQNGFKLDSLEVTDHPILGNNTFNFLDKEDDSNSIYFTVLIGSNGTGKSELLKLILHLFRGVYLIGGNRFRVNYFFALKFWNSGYLFEFSNNRDIKFVDITNKKSKYPSPNFYLNNKTIEREEFINAFPSSIIANSLMLTDKFIAPRNGREQADFPIYKYLGVRNRPQQASTRSYVRKTVEFIVEQLNSEVFKEGITNLSKFLGFNGSVEVRYSTIYTKKFYTGNLKKEELEDYFYKIDEQYKNSTITPPFKLNYFKSITKEDGELDRLVFFINTLFKTDRLIPVYRSTKKELSYRVDNNLEHSLLKEEYEHLDKLRKLGLVNPPSVNFIHNDKPLGIQQTSSGEFHFFSTMVGLMATVKPGSLILIDEPEISLHPNWQMKYLAFIRKLFNDPKYNTCHIIIATHSHFLISDLQGASSKIIGLKKTNTKILKYNNIKPIDQKRNHTITH